jgi:UDP-N-acetylmuramate: L-alanyl-gamma-D-glutamyl-meso-diaminopimelate ligase
MHIHILGICGTFMGGLAVLARESGHRVTGCDAGVYPPMSTQLQGQGIELIDGYGLEQLDLQPDLFVIGNVISRGNPLMEAILDRGLPYTSGPQWLGEHVLAGKWVLAVAGTHGKTTTSAMLAWLLEDAGLNPGFLIGGVPLNFGISARLTDSSFFVIEADEYDTAFFDKRSKFVHYRPRTVIMNNLEYDHADIFPDLAAIETQFHHLVRTVPSLGRILVNGREAALQRVLARGCWSEVEAFGVAQGWQARAAGAGALDQRFEVVWQDRAMCAVQWDVQGEHNRLNALAALAAARHVGVAQRRGRVAGPVSQRQAPHGSARLRQRHHRLRRFCASSDRHQDHAGRFAHPAGRSPGRRRRRRRLGRPAGRAHSCRARTALQHHEAGRNESRTTGQPGRCGPGVRLWRQ